MRKRLEFFALYGISWIILFQLFRVIFFIYHYQKAAELPPFLWVQSAMHGLQMDISFAGYILLIPTLLLVFTANKSAWYQKFLTFYSYTLGAIISVLVVIDLELFKAWGFRIDTTSLHYLETPAEAIASMGAAPVLPLLLLMIVLIGLTLAVLRTIIRRTVPLFQKTAFVYTIPAFLILTVSLIIPIRGGFQLAPMNESAVFFSDKSFANYAAVNVPWNYMSSMINAGYSNKNPFVYYNDSEADSLIRDLYTTSGDRQQLVDTTGKINVIVIIWESLTAKVVSGLNGLENVTPQFDSLSKEGILFTNMYASGNRSDKGIVAILSGYPAQPTHSIIKTPKKTLTLPSLPKEFRKNGWKTSFYYGGETEFANMKSYLLQENFDRIIDKGDFAKEDMNSKWGAHDHVVLNKLMQDLDKEKQPFFSTIFTLSSHEPFEVPAKTVIPGNDPEHLFLNAHHYTDSAIGDFIKTAKTKPWWDNTLIVIVADHGHPLPYTQKAKTGEFHIPMLWLGGALTSHKIKVNALCSQTDLAATLLGQLKLDPNAFQWTSDIFNKDRKSFAYFAFNNGLGWVRPGGFLVRDNLGGNITEREGALNAEEEKLAKAYLQASFGDYIRR
ncbi:Phosphoglycerol transferase I [Dyadobacter sp. CECT 9623]|uniref:Phosphoglycerol transferase I n=1 Tax=Dyadobacter linearis TaxID=2823330 RepID=A0ABM8UN32_9BACT|nr:alkaline phosphatase family protein [Dyadobacter sp. CECT 9623]CAG5068917.1 Phosphoglycerol transferase I [Dyadobacter sp. CECT 9623]